MMQIGHISITHWKLRHPSQVREMVAAIHRGALLPPVHLIEPPDGIVRIQDGHHRCLAYWLAGRASLHWGEYILFPVEKTDRPARGTLGELYAWNFPGSAPAGR